MIANIIIASLLFLLTTALTYAAWYLVRGARRKKTALKEKDTTQQQDPQEQYDGAYGKQSYCYPKINEVMGYDFVTVVRVPLVQKAAPQPKRIAYDQTSMIGFTNGAVTASSSAQDEDEAMIREDDMETAAGMQETQSAQGHQPNRQEPLTATMDEQSVSVEDIELLNKATLCDWPNRDMDETVTDEYVDEMINQNSDRIEESEPNEEQLRLSREQEALRRNSQMEKDLDDSERFSSVSMDIMDQLEKEQYE